jgi:acylphosphatase
MHTWKIEVKGKVQGVGYRFFTKSSADELGISGWVRNEEDGTVSIMAQSESSDILEGLIHKCAQGPSGSLVESLTIHHVENGEGLDDFQIIR